MDFECDKKSKEEFIKSTEIYWHSMIPNCRIEWYGSDDENNLVPLGEEKPTARIDLYMIVRIGSRGAFRYAIEIKERWGKYISTYYGEEGQEGWVYNVEKDSFLKKAEENGFIPIYANLYPDDVIRIWRMDKIKYGDKITLPIKKHNVIEGSPRIMQERYTLMNNQGKTYRRVKL